WILKMRMASSPSRGDAPADSTCTERSSSPEPGVLAESEPPPLEDLDEDEPPEEQAARMRIRAARAPCLAMSSRSSPGTTSPRARGGGGRRSRGLRYRPAAASCTSR